MDPHWLSCDNEVNCQDHKELRYNKVCGRCNTSERKRNEAGRVMTWAEASHSLCSECRRASQTDYVWKENEYIMMPMPDEDEKRNLEKHPAIQDYRDIFLRVRNIPWKEDVQALCSSLASDFFNL